MSAYIIVDIDIQDQTVFQDYVAKVEPLLQEKVHGFRNLSAEPSPEVLEGAWKPSMIVLHEFPDLDSASAFYHSEEYAPLIRLRQSASRASVVLVNGK